MKVFTITKEQARNLAMFAESLPSTDMKDARMTMNVANDLEEQIKDYVEAIRTIDVEADARALILTEANSVLLAKLEEMPNETADEKGAKEKAMKLLETKAAIEGATLSREFKPRKDEALKAGSDEVAIVLGGDKFVYIKDKFDKVGMTNEKCKWQDKKDYVKIGDALDGAVESDK